MFFNEHPTETTREAERALTNISTQRFPLSKKKKIKRQDNWSLEIKSQRISAGSHTHRVIAASLMRFNCLAARWKHNGRELRTKHTEGKKGKRREGWHLVSLIATPPLPTGCRPVVSSTRNVPQIELLVRNKNASDSVEISCASTELFRFPGSKVPYH